MNSKQLAWKIRRHAVEMTHLSRGSHIGSILCSRYSSRIVQRYC